MTADESAGAQKTHAVECSNQDYDFFYEGLEAKQLLVQKCGQCGILRSPPAPMCHKCRSLQWTAQPMSGRGHIWSYTVHRHPPLPGFVLPHPVGVVELTEGVRVPSGLDGIALEELRIGLPVEVEFFRRGSLATYCFRRLTS